MRCIMLCIVTWAKKINNRVSVYFHQFLIKSNELPYYRQYAKLSATKIICTCFSYWPIIMCKSTLLARLRWGVAFPAMWKQVVCWVQEQKYFGPENLHCSFSRCNSKLWHSWRKLHLNGHRETGLQHNGIIMRHTAVGILSCAPKYKQTFLHFNPSKCGRQGQESGWPPQVPQCNT